MALSSLMKLTHITNQITNLQTNRFKLLLKLSWNRKLNMTKVWVKVFLEHRTEMLTWI